MRLAELHAQLQTFSQMIAPHFRIDAALPNNLPPMHTGHTFEMVINGGTLDVRYVTRWDRLELRDVILFDSIKAEIEDYDLYPMFSDETQQRIVAAVERDFNDSERFEGDWQ